MCSYEYYIFKNSLFHRTPLVAASNSYKVALLPRNREIVRSACSWNLLHLPVEEKENMLLIREYNII